MELLKRTSEKKGLEISEPSECCTAPRHMKSLFAPPIEQPNFVHVLPIYLAESPLRVPNIRNVARTPYHHTFPPIQFHRRRSSPLGHHACRSTYGDENPLDRHPQYFHCIVLASHMDLGVYLLPVHVAGVARLGGRDGIGVDGRAQHPALVRWRDSNDSCVLP